MFDDENSNDFENGPLNPDHFRLYQEQIEKEFLVALEKGEDISFYLYLPHMFLSSRVREELDTFLLREAYKHMFEEECDVTTVYKDPYQTIVITNERYREETLKQMLEYFSESEEYEKCARIKRELDKIHV